jgi:hypothetical protein
MQNVIIFLVLSYLIGCGNNGSESNMVEPITDQSSPKEMAMMKMADVGENQKSEDIPVNADNQNQINKKIIKTGNISFKSKNLSETKKKIDNYVKKNNGYYSSESFNRSDYRNDYNLDIRIPSESFESFIQLIGNLEGNITNQNISANDVTSEYFDYEIRLTNKTAYLEKYREILKQARSIKDVLEVEDKIRVIEEEIESVKGRLKYLSDQVTLSTLNLNIYQEFDTPLKPADNFFARLWSSITKGWQGLTEFVLLFIMLWPFLIIGIVVFIVFYKWVRSPSKKVKA